MKKNHTEDKLTSEIAQHVADLSSRDLNVRKNAVGTLKFLAIDESPRMEIANEGGIVLWVSLLGDSNSGIKGCAANALWYLSEHEDNRIAIASAGGIAPLLGLLDDSKPDIKENAAGTLGNLAFKNANNQENIMRQGGMEKLMMTFSESESPLDGVSNSLFDNKLNQQMTVNARLFKGVAWALCSLMFDNKLNQQAIIQAGLSIRLLESISLLPKTAFRQDEQEAIQALVVDLKDSALEDHVDGNARATAVREATNPVTWSTTSGVSGLWEKSPRDEPAQDVKEAKLS